jgi:hypothetical protein
MDNEEGKMKKSYLLCMILCVGAYCFAQNENTENSYPLIKIAEFENKNEPGCFYIRKQEEVGPQDDATGSGIKFSTDGTAYMIQTDTSSIYQMDMKTYKLTYLHDLNFLLQGAEGINKITDKYLFCTGTWGRFQLLDWNFNNKFKISIIDWGERIYTQSAYYDEDSDVLFFMDNKYKMHSILHPGMDEAENRKNYRDPEATVKLFEADSGVDLHGLTRDEKGRIFKNGKYISYGPAFYTVINNLSYILDDTKIWISDYNDKDRAVIKIEKKNDEIYESTAVHPSGDIYMLRYNTKINKHILYKIENTWDKDAKSAWENKQS